MSLCFAFLCNDAGLSTTARAVFRDVLTVAEGAPNGWGLAYYQTGQPLLHKQPQALKDQALDLCEQMEALRTNIVLGHVRPADVSSRTTQDTQPFRFREWVFCHMGSVDYLGQIREEVQTAIPEFMRRNVRGSSDSELLFYLFLAFLNDAGHLDNERLAGAVAGRALSSALAYVDRLTSDQGRNPSPHCCIATNGHVLVATQRAVPLAVTRQSSYLNLGRGPDDKPLSYPHLKAVLLVGGRQHQTPGWESVDASAVVSIDAELNIEYLRADI